MASYLIVGQGLAGSLLADSLLKRAQNVRVIDARHSQSSSIVSAGIINPIIGKRFTSLEHFDSYYLASTNLYQELESRFGQKFFEPKPIIRLFKNEEEKEACRRNGAGQYFEQINAPGALSSSLNDQFGSIVIKHSGFCHSASLMDAFRQDFIKKNILIDQKFIYKNLVINDNHVIYDGCRFDKVIFCEGYQAHLNPLFSFIPFQCVKGEILKVKIEGPVLPDAIINQGKWIAPITDGVWAAGSNYKWGELNCDPTHEAREEILNGLQAMLPKHSVSVLEHRAAVRPVTADQQPILGLHPQYPALGIFNGLGSKGFLLAPIFAKALAEHMCNEGKLAEQFNVKRYAQMSVSLK